MRFLGGILRQGGRLSRANSGSTAIEFAMVIGPFLGLLFAIIEVALVYFAEFSLDSGVHKAARMIRLGNAQRSNYGANQFKQVICADIPAFMGCESNVMVDVRSFNTFAEAAANMPNPLSPAGTINPNFAQFTMGGPAQVVVVSLFYDWHLFATLPGLGDFTGKLGMGLGNMPDGSRLISAMTAFRTETYQ